MKNDLLSRFFLAVAMMAILLAGASPALAIQVPASGGRLADLAITDPSTAVAPEVAALGDPRVPAPLGAAWSSFMGPDGKGWDVYLDARSGAPLLVQGRGVPFLTEGGRLSPAGEPATIGSLAAMLRTFVASHEALLLADEKELM